jgi:hypothetical protein
MGRIDSLCAHWRVIRSWKVAILPAEDIWRCYSVYFIHRLAFLNFSIQEINRQIVLLLVPHLIHLV